ncbi:hypothetical protein HDV01_001251 [Terramyces sp. JEL0728]|nr:hypothetical protein HDV01_001251 [Terramyces sp. JEL0728]
MKVRPYQIELYEKALDENIITYLDTGCGKTLVSILLLQKLLGSGSLAIFLAPTNALVQQQANSIRNLSELSVGDYSSQNASLLNWSHDDWRKQFAVHQVLVMTPQLCLNLLRHGYVDLQNVELVIFDECHHGNKGHPYSLIMNEYYHTLEGKKPRILGLTASPIGHGIVTAKELQDRMTNLQDLFDSKIITIIDRANIGDYVIPITEIIVQFDKWADLADIPDFNDMCVSIQQAMEQQGESDTKKQLNAIKYLKEQFGLPIAKRYAELQYGKFNNKRKHPESDAPGFQILQKLPPKLQTLMRIIRTNFTSQGRSMIFVDRKATAIVLCDLINQLAVADFPFIKCGYLTGSSGGVKERESNLIGHKATLNYFRSGRYNTLVVTRVAEEGLDMYLLIKFSPTCNLIVIFDLFRSSIGYIQSRGRARSLNGSKYIIMVERNNLGHWKHVVDAKKTEELTRTVALQLMGSGSALQIDKNISDDEIISLISGELDLPLETDSGAKMFPSGAIQLLHWTCAVLQDVIQPDSLEYNQEWPAEASWDEIIGIFQEQLQNGIGNSYELEILQKEELDFGLVYSCSFVMGDKRVKVFGYPRMNKRLAKFHAAFNTCCFLFKNGIIDDRLLPKQKAKLQIENLKVSQAEALEDYCPAAFQKRVLCEYHITPIIIAEIDIQICVVTFASIHASKVPEFVLYFEGKEFRVAFGNSHQIELSTDQSDLLEQYTSKVWDHALNIYQKIAKNDKSGYFGEIEQRKYYIAPLLETTIDWDSISMLTNYQPTNVSNVNVDIAKMVICTKHNNRKYFNLEKVSGIGINDGFIKTGSSKKSKTSYKDYFTDLGYEITSNTDLLRGYAVPLIRNCLIKTEEAEHREAILLSDACTAIPVSKSFLVAMHLFPTILWKLTIAATIDDFFGHFDFKNIPKCLIYPAFITPNADEIQNYDRLEILGDSFLKYASSLYLYAKKEHKSEGELSKQRSVIVSNNTLYRTAMSRQFAKYLTVVPFASSFWSPSGRKPWRMINPDPEELPPVKTTGRKTLADFLEALVGAYYLHTKDNGAWYILSKLNLLPEWDTISINLETLKLNSNQNPQLSIHKLQQTIGYTFKDTALLGLCFTHPSFNPKANYERLEFLGDSILDLLIIKYCFEKYPQAAPGMLSKLKQAAVNNESLARLAFSMQLHNYCQVRSFQIQRDTDEYLEYLNGSEIFIDPFETLIEGPKIMGDVMEALIAVLFIDCDCDLDKVWGIIYPLWAHFLDTFITPESATTSPVRMLMEYFQGQGIDAKDIKFSYATNSNSGSYDCIITVKGLEISKAAGNTKVMAKKKAAKLCLGYSKNI